MFMNNTKSALFFAFTFVFSALYVSADDKPNILILYADDIGYGDLGCYNSESKIPTPTLDKLAQEGMRFTDGHSSSGICSPSRYALLTGRYHWRKFHHIAESFGASKFSPEELTLPEMLQENGYTTAVIGKWHLGWDWDSIRNPGAKPEKQGKRLAWQPDDFDWSKPIPDGPLDHGFDYYFGDNVINFPPYVWIENNRVLDVPDTMIDTENYNPAKEGYCEIRPGPMVTGWDPYDNIPTTTAKGVEKIKEYAEQNKPFFLYFAFPSPHQPIIPHDEFDGTSQAGPYGDYVVETDAACGTLLKALEEAGVADNTIVIFTADNGAEHYAYKRDERFDHWSSYPLRGVKRDIYEGGHRVPFIVRWPGVVSPDSVSNALVSQIDIMRTLAAVLNVSLPEDQAIDSYSLLPILEGKAKTAHQSLVHNTYQDRYAIRYDDWVLIDCETGYMQGKKRHEKWEERHAYPEDDSSPVELYDLSTDIGQKNNVAAAHPEVVEKLKKELNSIRQSPSTL